MDCLQGKLVRLGVCFLLITTVSTDDFYYNNLAWGANLWRVEHLEQMCDNLRLTDKNRPPITDLDHLIVDHKHKLIYCYVPKVACTNWKRVIMVLTGKSNRDVQSIAGSDAHAPNNTIRLSEIPEAEANFYLRNYTKFLFVRHPFERLLSAYRNKLEDHIHESARYFQSRVGKHIIKNYRANATMQSLNKGDDVTFLEFAQYLLREGHGSHASNEHWRPINQLCHPCTIRYDIVGKYETLLDDSEMILVKINASITFPEGHTSNTWTKLAAYYTQLPTRIIKQLYRFYRLDFKLFGYGLDSVLGFDLS